MPEFSENVWAPWRYEYIQGLSEKDGGCFLCRYHETPDQDEEHLVVWRSPDVLGVLNRFPYTSGHLLIAPTAHVANLEDLSEDVVCELVARIRDATRVLRDGMNAQGFNIGMNLGRCAGAGLPDHLHWHIVPRWGGDTNFMAVIGDVRVLPQALKAAYDVFRTSAARLGL